jgi:hypothetical protein
MPVDASCWPRLFVFASVVSVAVALYTLGHVIAVTIIIISAVQWWEFAFLLVTTRASPPSAAPVPAHQRSSFAAVSVGPRAVVPALSLRAVSVLGVLCPLAVLRLAWSWGGSVIVRVIVVLLPPRVALTDRASTQYSGTPDSATPYDVDEEMRGGGDEDNEHELLQTAMSQLVAYLLRVVLALDREARLQGLCGLG